MYLGGQIVMEASAFGLCAIMIGWLSEVDIAAHQIAMQQMRGGFSSEIKKLREELLNFASLIELELLAPEMYNFFL